ncbi:hypothetical protein [Pseudaestuariivita sp.]|uniref:hypothetical protein n=1 Tax=Pseudaestuariivita sp. TaxID=2211669 RepID=UPI00405A44C3
MAYEKIATCCYCGARTALTLRGSDRHELACSNCGAPLHNMKRLPSAKTSEAKKKAGTPKPAISHQGPAGGGFFAALQASEAFGEIARGKSKPLKKRKKRRKGLMSKLFDEAFDVIEDIFD